MIKSLLSALKTLVGKPYLIVPALATAFIVFLLSLAFEPFLQDFGFNAIVLEKVPDTALHELPFHFLSMYPTGLAALGLFAILSCTVIISLSYWYAVYAKMLKEGKTELLGACRETMAGLKDIITLIIFIAIISLLFAALTVLFSVITQAVEVLGLLLLGLLALAGGYLYIMLAFVVQILAIEKQKVKEALQQAWQFSSKRFWQVFLFILAIAVINYAVGAVASSITDLALDETTDAGITAIFWSIAVSYSGIAMALYYLGKK